jgi:hypothetical protein
MTDRVVRFSSRPFGFLPASLIQVQVVFQHPVIQCPPKKPDFFENYAVF